MIDYTPETLTGKIVWGNCLPILRRLPDKSIQWTITDPPYGVNKAEWDTHFPTDWIVEAKRISNSIAIITGSSQLKYAIPPIGNDLVDVMAARNLNGMTIGQIGFGNWIAIVLWGNKPRMGMNFFEFSVSGDMPDHPSPKPIQLMKKLINRLTNEGDIVLDCFAGSCTTAVACHELNRKWIMVERELRYVGLARRRLDAVIAQQRLKL